MVNAPTNSEMRANTSSAVLKNDSDWSTAVMVSFTTVCAVTTSTPGGSTLAMSRCTVALSAPALVITLMVSNSPVRLSTACAVGRLNPAKVSPARLPPEPNWAMPLMVNVRDGPSDRMRTRWPTVKP